MSAQAGAPAGKTLEQIFGMLSSMYMKGYGLRMDQVKSDLQGMVVSGKLSFTGGRYTCQ